MALLSIFSIISILAFHVLLIAAVDSDFETYIIHVDSPDAQLASESEDLESWYRSFLPASTTTTTTAGLNDDEEPRLVYSYRNVFKGFAARLSKEEVKEMETKTGFISAQPQEILSLQTTHTPNFLGLNQNSGFWQDSNYGRGVIIGVLDTGVNPEHPSFSGEGMPPPPAKWRGVCQFSNAALCNNKLIGARFFSIANGSPLDDDGHGSHTTSTAAGNYVRGANLFGNANGTAAGVAPLAHLAIYRVCSGRGCAESDIVAAIDAAIEDGVDVLSMSLGGRSRPFHMDNIAIGTFSAIANGIFVSCGAGNSGPSLGSLSNEAPWLLTVGASSTDRRIIATAVLGNTESFVGESVFQPNDFPSAFLPLVYPGSSLTSATYCLSGTLTNVQGQIVVCEEFDRISPITQGRNVRAAGGAAMILINKQESGYTIQDHPHVLPVTHLNYADGRRVLDYIASTNSSTATILFNGTSIGDNRAPMVASFSSRGPNRQSLGILKPDIIGPGLNILAAWHLSVENNTNTRSNFKIISGTSMSCPHLSGVAALLRSAHPDWSPAIIKSAIMTTADIVNLENAPIQDEMLQPANFFATGAGHVNPSRANNPGLVYDIQPQDYISYLCGLNYTNAQVSTIVQQMVDCSQESAIPQSQLNYPSFSVLFGSEVQRYTRTITNVGDAAESYTVQVVAPRGVNVTVEPTTLSFTGMNQNLTYAVTFTRLITTADVFSQGSVTWTSTRHSVRSPVLALLS